MESSPVSPSSMQFLHVMPLQLPHAEMHFTGPFFLQLHLRLLQSRVPWGLKLESAHNHESIHSQWGPKTCSATEANLGFGDRHGGNAVQLHPLLEVEPPG